MRSRHLLPRITAAAIVALALAALPAGAKEPAKAAGPIDLNTASLSQLKSLPGVDEVFARKIVAGRPIQSVADLARVGVPAKTIEKITPLVTVGAAAPKPAPSGKGATGLAAARAQAEAPAKTPPVAGMVWVNPDSKAYHKQGDKWYGRTQRGQFMTEADARKAGYHPADERKRKAP